MVRPGEIVSFKLGRAYVNEGVGSNILRIDDTPSGTPEPYGDDDYEKFDADVLWDDADVIRSINVKGKGPDAELTVITDKGKDGPIPTGNAVVAIKKNTGEIAWSYHIWVTEGVNTATNNGYVFMDRNLGATFAGTGIGSGTGLFYQWGRKDPFTIVFNYQATSVSLGTVVNTIKNPSTFYHGTSESTNDWCYSHDLTLWGGSVKSIYDPCPNNWCIPTNNNSASQSGSPWYGYWTINGGIFDQGWTWGSNAKYPAPGVIWGDGKAALTGPGLGACWLGNRGKALFYSVSSCDPYYSHACAHGFNVRCVQE
jgi:hypothetical protein